VPAETCQTQNCANAILHQGSLLIGNAVACSIRFDDCTNVHQTRWYKKILILLAAIAPLPLQPLLQVTQVIAAALLCHVAINKTYSGPVVRVPQL